MSQIAGFQRLTSRYKDPLQLLLLMVCGWANRDQREVVSYLVEENR